MRNYAKQKGWWNGTKEFDFAATYSYIDTVKMMTSPGRYCEGYRLLNKHKGNHLNNVKMKNSILCRYNMGMIKVFLSNHS